MTIQEYQLFQLLITAGSGLVGVGIGIGMFKGAIKQIKEDVKTIKLRQARLRGEDNGGVPVFITKINCQEKRHECARASSEQMEDISKDLNHHTKAIKVLENFARWRMQAAGLKIEEINQILNMD